MNKFDEIFFSKYIPEGENIKDVAHKHIISIIYRVFITYLILALIPTLIYYYVDFIKALIPFFIFEIYIIGTFLKIFYDIFGWYNDAWIITNSGVIELEWQLFNVNLTTIGYDNIEGIEFNQQGIIDSILGKGELVIHKVGGDGFLLEEAYNPQGIINEIEKNSKGNHHHHHEVHESHEEEEIDDEEIDENQLKEKSFETILQALSGVVEDYLGKNGYEKKDYSKKEKEKYIDEIKKEKTTIDLR